MIRAVGPRRVGFLLVLCCLTAGCGLFDSGIEWRHGRYALMWIDDPDEVSLSYDQGRGAWSGRVEPRVFAVGANDRYIVARQHPGGDRRITSYFIIDMKEDSLSKPAVVGPLTAQELDEQSERLRLPPFTKILESLQ